MPVPLRIQEVTFYEAAQDYLRYLRTHHPEHFMEANPQGLQRKITLESLDLVAAKRSDVHLYNEMLVQYRRRGSDKIHQIVPDNMIVLYEGKLDVETSYDVPLQPVGPFWTLEYVSKKSKRKDYNKSFDKYERYLKVPYYLTFYPDNDELTLYRHNKRKYVTVKPDEKDRYAIPELEMELAIYEGWLRYWFRGKLLPLPAQLQEENAKLQQQLDAQIQHSKSVEERLGELEAEVERLRRKRNGP